MKVENIFGRWSDAEGHFLDAIASPSSYLKGEELEGVTDSLRDDTDILEVQRKAFLWGDWETMWQQEKEEEGATAIW